MSSTSKPSVDNSLLHACADMLLFSYMKKGAAKKPFAFSDLPRPLTHHEIVVKGGKLSRSKMTPKQATKIARKANKVRWDNFRARGGQKGENKSKI